MHSNGFKLAQIAQEGSTDNKLMASLANRTHRDSRIMRIMTLIALFYLPTNLVLVRRQWGLNSFLWRRSNLAQ
jgi:hypothetical protein